jgi:hypothetical protein
VTTLHLLGASLRDGLHVADRTTAYAVHVEVTRLKTFTELNLYMMNYLANKHLTKYKLHLLNTII